MDVRQARPNRLDTGFTLIEITFAVLILTGSLVVLLGLQSSVLQRTIADNRTQEALLSARSILAYIESSTEPLIIGNYTGTPTQVLQDLGAPQAEESRSGRESNLQTNLDIQYWGIPEVNEQAMKRIALSLAWGDSTIDRIELLYFIPNDEALPE